MCPKAHVNNLRPTDDVDGLVGMLGDVVSTASIVLNKNVIDWMPEHFLHMLADQSDGWRERKEWR